MKPDKIALILTTFNGENYLAEQIGSILDQEDVDIDVFVFDDGSKDKTLEIVENFKEKLNITIHQNNPNSGGTGKNIFINLREFDKSKIYEYQYFALCDQDDIWHKDKLTRAIKQLKEKNASLYCSNLLLWNSESGISGSIRKNHPMTRYDYLFEGGSAGCTYVMDSNFIGYVHDIIQDYPIENKKRLSHDWLFYFLARLGDFDVVFDKESKIFYRIHNNNQYGHLSKISFKSIMTRINLVKNGFYQTQINNNIFFLEKESKEYQIYESYMSSLRTRIYILLYYNFKLMRSKKKFLFFFFLSIFFVKTHDLAKIKD